MCAFQYLQEVTFTTFVRLRDARRPLSSKEDKSHVFYQTSITCWHLRNKDVIMPRNLTAAKSLI